MSTGYLFNAGGNDYTTPHHLSIQDIALNDAITDNTVKLPE
jgi:hypothetical protein